MKASLTPASTYRNTGSVTKNPWNACALTVSSWNWEEYSRNGSSRLGRVGFRFPTLSSGYGQSLYAPFGFGDAEDDSVRHLLTQVPSASGPATIALISEWTKG